MKKLFSIVVVLGILLSSCTKGIYFEKDEIILTLRASEKINYSLSSAAENQTIIWESENPDIAIVSEDGVVTAVNFGTNGTTPVVNAYATGSTTITARTADGKFKNKIKVTTTTQPIIDMMTLPPLKDQFSDYFMIGNIMNPNDASPSAIVNERLTYHYNFLTAENNMKPDHLSPRRGQYNFATADRMVNAALASGFKVHGHTLLWHSQIPEWQRRMASADRATALAAMREFVTDVVTHFKGRVYSWDVLNEIFPDGVSVGSDWRNVMRGIGDSQSPNPWLVAIGPDFIYEGFLAARRADPDAILYYNDYNTDQNGKATMIRDMVRDVNARYAREFPNANRPLIDGIGMQEHHNTGVGVAGIKNAIQLFRPLGVRLAVTELDVLAQNWTDFSGGGGSGPENHLRSTVLNNGLRSQARLYGLYFNLYMENADIIERVSWWGVIDSQSWRSRGLPLLFDSMGRAKPAYFGVVSQLER